MNRLTRLLLIGAALLIVRNALALDPERSISELAHRSWSTKDGAPAYVLALAQTTDGYLWLAGFRGLYRYDGWRFEPFKPLSGAKLPSTEISALFASPDGRLWIGYLHGGVSVLEAGKLTNYSAADGFPQGRVNGFTDRNGRIWAASVGGLAYFEGGRWRVVGTESNFAGSGAQAVLVDHLGVLWVAGEHRIAVLGKGSSRFELLDEPYNGQVRMLAESPDGTVWMAETTRAVRPISPSVGGPPLHGLSRADCQTRFPDTWASERRCQRANQLEVRVGSAAMLFDRNGSLWITTLGDGLRRAPHPAQLRREPIAQFSNALEQFTTKEGLTADFVTAILEDREGNIWVATRDGVDQFRNSDLVPVDLGPEATRLSMAPGDNGEVFASTGGGRVYRFHDGHERTLVAKHAVGGGTLYRDSLGSIWITGFQGACRVVEQACIDRVEIPAVKQSPWAGQWQFAIDENGRPWAYVENVGLFVRENGRWSALPSVSSAATRLVPITQFTDASGQIWFGFTNGQLLSLKDRRVRVYSSDAGPAVGAIKAIYCLGTHVWVGGEGGLALLRGSRFTAVLPYDAATFGSVSGVVEGDDGSVWLNEYRGVVRIPAAEAARILQGSAHRPRYELLTSLDGLPGDTEQAGPLPTAIRGTDGRLWFAGTRGVAWVDPTRLHRDRLPLPPPVVIQSIVADGKTLAPSAKLEFPGTTANLQISYAGLSFTIPERVQFRYWLKGLDHDWQNAGTRRTAYYTKLTPGSYDFQVVASNDTGVWNDVGAGLRIVVLPAWYQTRWFYALCALLVAATLAALYRTHVAQVRADTRRLLEARLSERERIARDLHDTLLQSMQGLMLRFRAAANFIPASERARDMMERALERAGQVLIESRDQVTELRMPAESLPNLPDALAEAAAQMGVASSSQFRLTVEGEPRELHPIVREEAFLISREALANAFRHAQAQWIEVEVTYNLAALTIRIRDDGCGVDTDVLHRGGAAGRWGLLGMRERAAKIRGRLDIWSNVGAGTEVELLVPGEVAYRGVSTVKNLPWWRRLALTRLRKETSEA